MMDSQQSYRERSKIYRKNREDRLAGKLTCIPFYTAFPRLSKSVPGLVKGVMYKILSYTGIGKTKFAKFLSISLPYKTEQKYKDKGFSFKTFYFLLEETIDEALDELTVSILAQYYNIYIDVLELKAIKEDLMDEKILDKIESEEFQAKAEDILKNVEFVDNISNTYGMYKKVRSYCQSVGTVHKKEITNKSGKKEMIFSHYTPNDPNHYVIGVMGDHISLQSPENGTTLHATIAKHSMEYCRKRLCGDYGCVIINIQQIEMKGDDTNNFKAGRLEPTNDKAATNKEIIRDDLVVFALFSPNKYAMKKYMGYTIADPQNEEASLKDNFRALIINKNRLGTPGMGVGLFFNGASGEFRELPIAKDAKGMRNVYKLINKIKQK